MNPVWLAALTLAATPTVDEEAATHMSPHTEETSWLLGLKGVQLTAIPSEGETLIGGGLGLFAERTAIPGWLEIELSASFVRIESENEWIVPIDVLLKKPFHVGSGVCPYLAIGSTVSLVTDGEGLTVGVGGVVVVGTYIWLSDSWGIDVEVDYALLYEEGVQHEVTVAAGPTLRF